MPSRLSIAADARSLMPYLRTHNAMVLGPGIGRGPATTHIVGEILKIVYEQQLDNQVRTLEEAIESARRIMGSS